MRKLPIIIACVLIFLLIVPAAFASLPGYISVKGAKQGVMTSSTNKANPGSTKFYAMTHEVRSPMDAASGLPTGKRQHGVLTITKEWDRSSPMFYNAMATNENLPEVTLRFYKPSAGGSEINYYIIKLTNARIVDIRSYKLLTLDPQYSSYPDLEDVGFVYQKIEWTYVDGGVTASDDWETPVA